MEKPDLTVEFSSHELSSTMDSNTAIFGIILEISYFANEYLLANLYVSDEIVCLYVVSYKINNTILHPEITEW